MVVRRAVPVVLGALLALSVATPMTTASATGTPPDPCAPPDGNAMRGENFMVAAAAPDAVRAGCQVLLRGGSAADAAVAVQAALGVVEPQSSGLGGGSLITYYDAGSGKTQFYDGLSAAGAEVTPELSAPTEQEQAEHGIDEFSDAVGYTGRAVSVPGTVAVLDELQGEHGSLAWQDLFTEAERLARDGFAVSPYMHDMLSAEETPLPCRYPDLRARYCAGDEPKPVGTEIVNTELADVLSEVAEGGADAFYDPEGDIAPAIVDKARAGEFKPDADEQGPAVLPSLLSAADFGAYQAKQRDPLCAELAQGKLCTAPPPAHGGLSTLAILDIENRLGANELEPGSLEQAHQHIEASRLAGVDSRAYVGDPDFDNVPVDGLRSADYLDERAALVSPDKAIEDVQPGEPAGAPARSSDARQTGDNTSHISIVDAEGNAVSMTTTVNLGFGSRIEARGMILNDAQTNFSAADAEINRMEPTKRPRTSIAPSIVYDDAGEPALVAGSAGGAYIPDYVTQTVSAVLDHGMDPARALALPHLSGQRTSDGCVSSAVERGTAAEALLPGLRELGHPCAEAIELRSGQTAVGIGPDGALSGAADPRRDGTAIGG
ncbi:gamma-glutamyltransferase 1 [Tamaricihabitans halophyticus]|uniref:Gamma-glutamyltransferase 1 n=1 Tax=Tamaricihabitans halophyticus TaxID=1262583 RepID=A0A4R2QXK5_9PSEU|nr:gamma-glutamyltransferase [Tamaricihabitans halophyticus]TCP54883.1 gamma-glutamyltransferase 1 [Tamaricihabitans halophyticus]